MIEEERERDMHTPGQLSNPEVRDQKRMQINRTHKQKKTRRGGENERQAGVEWPLVSVCRVSRSVSHHVLFFLLPLFSPTDYCLFLQISNSPEHIFERMVLFF